MVPPPPQKKTKAAVKRGFFRNRRSRNFHIPDGKLIFAPPIFSLSLKLKTENFCNKVHVDGAHLLRTQTSVVARCDELYSRGMWGALLNPYHWNIPPTFALRYFWTRTLKRIFQITFLQKITSGTLS